MHRDVHLRIGELGIPWLTLIAQLKVIESLRPGLIVGVAFQGVQAPTTDKYDEARPMLQTADLGVHVAKLKIRML